MTLPCIKMEGGGGGGGGGGEWRGDQGLGKEQGKELVTPVGNTPQSKQHSECCGYVCAPLTALICVKGAAMVNCIVASYDLTGRR